MVGTFRELHGLHDGVISDAERTRVATLVEEKFLTDEWLRRVP
jgi:lipoate-protein ligase A